ncbi:MAG: hypothetical protein WDO15_30505 [Bacteroidota bacterium]
MQICRSWHNLYILKEALPQFKDYDRYYVAIGNKLLKEDINNPYANNYMADYYRLNNNPDSARIFYTRIAELKNFSRAWYITEAESWLQQNPSTSK